MEINIKNKKQNLNILRFKEHKWYNQKLHAVTLFPYNNIHKEGKFYKMILNFTFKDLEFNKKKVLPFFLAVELLTNQKCIATLSSKNVLIWKLRKGMLVGCKVTLRNEILEDFFDSLLLASPRMERYTLIKIINKKMKEKSNFFLIKLSELLFFYPIELGLGINSQVRKVELNFVFNTLSIEEKIFLLTSKKIPINFEK